MTSGKESTARILELLACDRPRCVCRASLNRGRGLTHCPAHDDQSPSLSISPPERTAWPVMHCHAGCSFAEVRVALQRAGGLPVRTTFNVNGVPHYRTDGAAKKTMSWPKGTSPRTLLYRSEILSELEAGSTVVVVEGEAACEAAEGIGLHSVATLGADVMPTKEMLEQLRAFDVVLAPDNDEPGRRHMQQLGQALREVGVRSRLLDVPGLPEKGDMADFKGTPEEIAALVAAAPKLVPSTLRFVTARQLSAATPEQPNWLVEGLVARGVLTELGAKIKVGKSTFWAFMVAALLQGRPFIGRQTKSAPVVLLTEERESTIRALLRRAGIEGEDRLHILQRHGTRDWLWHEIVADAVVYALAVGAELLIVDTLPDWAGIRGDAENNTGDALRAMGPLQDAAAQGLAVLVVRHDRKGGGEIGDSARGASAFGGAVDIILGLRRADTPGHENRRTLLGVGRFDDVPDELTLDLVDGEYLCLGTGADVERQQARVSILDLLPLDGEGAMSEGEIVEQLDTPRSTIRRAIEDCQKRGEIVRHATGAGKSGRAAGYSRAMVATVVSTIGNDPGQSSKGDAPESGVPEECSGVRIPEHNELSSPPSLDEHNEPCPGPNCGRYWYEGRTPVCGVHHPRPANGQLAVSRRGDTHA